LEFFVRHRVQDSSKYQGKEFLLQLLRNRPNQPVTQDLDPYTFRRNLAGSIALQYRNAVSVMQIALDNKHGSLLGFSGRSHRDARDVAQNSPACLTIFETSVRATAMEPWNMFRIAMTITFAETGITPPASLAWFSPTLNT
jgi:hypothetical protein